MLRKGEWGCGQLGLGSPCRRKEYKLNSSFIFFFAFFWQNCQNCQKCTKKSEKKTQHVKAVFLYHVGMRMKPPCFEVRKSVAKGDPDAEPPTCASYNGRFEDPQNLQWVLGLSAVVGMLMSYGKRGRGRACACFNAYHQDPLFSHPHPLFKLPVSTLLYYYNDSILVLSLSSTTDEPTAHVCDDSRV